MTKKRFNPEIETLPTTDDDGVRRMLEDPPEPLSEPFGWPLSRFAYGSTVTGRHKPQTPPFTELKPRPYQMSALEALQARDQTTRTDMSGREHRETASADYAALERSMMAVIAERTKVSEKRIDPDAFLAMDNSEIERVRGHIEKAMQAALVHWLADFLVSNLQTQIDEEGCGAAIAALKDWGD